MRIKIGTRILSCALAALLAVSGLAVSAFAEEPVSAAQDTVADAAATGAETADTYYAYFNRHQEDPKPEQSYTASYESVSGSSVKTASYDGMTGAVLESAGDWIEWELDVAESGCYAIGICYYPLPGRGKDPEISLTIDGKYPFGETANLDLPRIWVDSEDSFENGRFQHDSIDNEMRPTQVEKPRWVERTFMDNEGYFDGAYAFYLEKGTHRFRMAAVKESIAVNSLRVFNDTSVLSYAEYIRQYTDNAGSYAEYVQAEFAYEKSSSMLYPTSDRTDAATQPSHPSRIKYNTIGASNWVNPNQFITWKLPAVESSGYYRISFRAKQNYQQGMTSYRRLYVNGKIPFKEAEEVAFHYSDKWYLQTLGGSEPLLIYLKAGKENTITLESTPGKIAYALRQINQIVLDMNELYRDIIMVTSANPDLYNDYYLDVMIPDLEPRLVDVRQRVDEVSAYIKRLTGSAGTEASILDQVSYMLKDIIEDTDTIPERLSKFKENVESLGSLLLLLKEQPLELDYLYVSDPSQPLPKAVAGFGEKIAYSVRSFISSFLDNYNSVGRQEKDALTVWVSTGRDQAQIIKRMIDESFTPVEHVSINLNLVDTGSTLMQATLAGKGPDIAMMIGQDTPVNLAMRGALVDLSRFDGLNDIKDSFYASAWIPFQYQGGIYAIPETQSFDMLFYRKDIFEKLGLTPPETWEDFYRVLLVLQQNNLQVGISEADSANAGVSSGISHFDKFLYQRGGRYYTDDLKKTRFDTAVAYDAFEEWVNLYTVYGLDRQFDFYNRFRTGEMPMSIQNYGMYNMLSQAAPELKGLWDFTVIPGTRRADGTIDRTETGGVSGCIMLKGIAEDQTENGFRFMAWWTSADVQAKYGNELEAVMGLSARYSPANKEAFKQIAWTETESAALLEQWSSVTQIEQVPGNYYISRCLTNAIRMCLREGGNSRRYLNRYNKEINAEITRKRKEFNLD